MELTDLDTLIDELDERITGAELPVVEAVGSELCSILICDSTVCESVLC
ncbi:hypothetical protein [Streptomyces sp. NPDC056061]